MMPPVKEKLVDDGGVRQPMKIGTLGDAVVNEAESQVPNKKNSAKLAMPALTELGGAIMARLELVLDTPVGPGMYTAFEVANYRTTMATTLWQLDLCRPAMPNTPVSLAEVEAYRKEKIGACAAGCIVKWPQPIAVVVTSRESPGAPGQLRKISMDTMIYAFLLEWWERLQQTTAAAVVDGFWRPRATSQSIIIGSLTLPTSRSKSSFLAFSRWKISGRMRRPLLQAVGTCARCSRRPAGWRRWPKVTPRQRGPRA